MLVEVSSCPPASLVILSTGDDDDDDDDDESSSAADLRGVCVVVVVVVVVAEALVAATVLVSSLGSQSLSVAPGPPLGKGFNLRIDLGDLVVVAGAMPVCSNNFSLCKLGPLVAIWRVVTGFDVVTAAC